MQTVNNEHGWIQAEKQLPNKFLLHTLVIAEPDLNPGFDEQHLAEQKSLVLTAQTTRPA